MAVLDARRVGLRIAKRLPVRLLGELNVVRRAIENEDRLDRQNTWMIWPDWIGARSTSTGAPAAMVDASGFICPTSGASSGSRTDGAYGRGRNVKKIAARWLRR